MLETVAMADNKTQTMSIEDRYRLPLKSDVVFEGGKGTYEIYAGSRIGVGGESQVHLAKRASDDEQVVAKIYDNFKDDLESHSNRRIILNFLNKNSDYERTHIMPLLDSGVITMESSDGEYIFTRPLDITVVS